MTPHLLASISGARRRDHSALQEVSVEDAPHRVAGRPDHATDGKVVTEGTASRVGFLPQDDVAAKTGTAQVGNALTNDTDDWMIAFAPADGSRDRRRSERPLSELQRHGCHRGRPHYEVRHRSSHRDE